jgi:3-hydroxy-D-aspartate aldolase
MPHVLMLKCGDGILTQYIELFEFVSPNQNEVARKGEKGWLRFSDIANSYISFTVKDLDSVMLHIRTFVFPKYGGRFIQDPPMNFPLRGEVCRSTFLVSPWGMWIELTEWSESRHKKPVIRALQGSEEVMNPYIGKTIAEIPTPSFLVDLDSLENNAKLMGDRFAEKKMKWCPTGKGHKCPSLVKKMHEFGAEGVVALTVDEAMGFSLNGIDDIYLANEIVGEEKINRLSLLAKRVKRLRVNVESMQNLTDLEQAVKKWEIATPIHVMVELNINHNRCGVSPHEAVELAKAAKRLENAPRPCIVFAGICGYEGHTPILPPEQKLIETQKSHAILAEAKALIEKEGIEVPIVSGGGSSNYPAALQVGVLTEIQAGGGALTDSLYAYKAGLIDHGHKIGSLTLTTIMSVSPQCDRAMGDAGFKSVGWHPFGGLPLLRDRTDLKVIGLSAEHTKLQSSEEGGVVNVKRGDKVVMINGYTDAMGFLHKRIFAVRGDVVEAVWQTLV